MDSPSPLILKLFEVVLREWGLPLIAETIFGEEYRFQGVYVKEVVEAHLPSRYASVDLFARIDDYSPGCDLVRIDAFLMV